MKITVLLVTYNQEKYIQKAIEGVLMQQDCGEYEIVVSDDHSTDHTLSLITEMLGDRQGVRIYSNEKNLGVTGNYQRAFSRCQGDYIFTLEGDDYWTDPAKLKKQVDFMDAHPFCTLCGHPYYAQRDELGIFSPPLGNVNGGVSLFDCKDIILDPSIINNFSVCCYRRSVLEKISPETFEVTSYDWMINMSVAQFGQVGRINTPMSVYRVSATGSWSGKSEAEQLEGILSIIPAYDRILGYRYQAYFEEKKKRLTEQLLPEKRSFSYRDYLPPIVLAIGKLLVPRALLSFRGSDHKVRKK